MPCSGYAASCGANPNFKKNWFLVSTEAWQFDNQTFSIKSAGLNYCFGEKWRQVKVCGTVVGQAGQKFKVKRDINRD